MVITELEVGGAERCLTNLAIGLNSQRFAPIVYSLASRPVPGRDALVERLEAHGIPVRFLNADSALNFGSAIRRLRRCWRSDRPQVAQTFLFHANVLSALATFKRRIPVLSFGFRVSDPTGWRQYLERFVADRAARVVCVSDSVADFARQKVGIAADKIQVIPNGIEMDQYTDAKPADLTAFGVPPGAKTIVCVARLTEQKGVDRLVRAAPQILSHLPDHHLLLVGDGPDRPQLGELALQLGVADHLHFAGWQAEIPAILRASTLLVLPSRWEGMPNALLEAMACGLPVVSTRTDGVQQVLGPLSDQQTTADHTPQAIADKVVKVSGDTELSRHLGRENQQRVRDKFSLVEMVAQYEWLFEALAATANDE